MLISPFRLHRFFIAAISLGLLLNSSAITTQAQARAYVTNACDTAVDVIDLDTNKVVATVPVDPLPRGVAITPDGARVYVVSSLNGIVSVIDTGTNTVVATIPVGGFPTEVAITPDGARAYVAIPVSNTVAVIDTETNTVVDTIVIGAFPIGVAITPDGTRLYVPNDFNESQTIKVFDTATNALVATIIPFRFTVGVVFTPDGARGYVEQPNEFLDVIETATNTVVIDALQPNVVHSQLAITADGTRLYATAVEVRAVSVIDTSTNAVIHTIPLDFNPLFSALTSDGTRIYTANVQNTISVINAVTNTVIDTIRLVPATDPTRGCLHEIAITPVPKNKDDCKDGGYRKFRGLAFPNQGQCVKYVNRHAN